MTPSLDESEARLGDLGGRDSCAPLSPTDRQGRGEIGRQGSCWSNTTWVWPPIGAAAAGIKAIGRTERAARRVCLGRAQLRRSRGAAARGAGGDLFPSGYQANIGVLAALARRTLSSRTP
jgi:hypothetical protein